MVGREVEREKGRQGEGRKEGGRKRHGGGERHGREGREGEGEGREREGKERHERRGDGRRAAGPRKRAVRPRPPSPLATANAAFHYSPLASAPGRPSNSFASAAGPGPGRLESRRGPGPDERGWPRCATRAGRSSESSRGPDDLGRRGSPSRPRPRCAPAPCCREAERIGLGLKHSTLARTAGRRDGAALSTRVARTTEARPQASQGAQRKAGNGLRAATTGQSLGRGAPRFGPHKARPPTGTNRAAHTRTESRRGPVAARERLPGRPGREDGHREGRKRRRAGAQRRGGRGARPGRRRDNPPPGRGAGADPEIRRN